jgi:4-hydroxyphenylpyruvate dioxygenase-like putative hemolysin
MSRPVGKTVSKPAGEPVAKLGPVAHIGLVVRDCDKTAKLYSQLFGIEFAIDDYDMSKGKFFNVDGKPTRARFRAAFSQGGPVSIELVEVLEGETPHTRFLNRHGEGLQHLCFYVDDMQATMTRLEKAGLRPILDYEFETVYDGRRSRIQEVYLSTDEIPGGATIQLLQVDPLE